MSNVQDASVTGSSGRNPQRILLVDDDELELELLADRFKSLGFETHTVSDGSAALELLRTQSFPVVITDWQMPRMDGMEATRKLRSEPNFRYTPIIALSALAMPSDRERCLEAGMDEYISKPVNLKALVKIIQGWLFSSQEIKSQ